MDTIINMNKTVVEIKNGVIIHGSEAYKNLLYKLDGQYIVDFISISSKEKDDLARYYFVLRDILYEDGETGYTKNQLHDMAKRKLLPILADDGSNFDDTVELTHKDWMTTKWLSKLGWQRYIEAFKAWSFENFNCYL